MSSRFLLGSQRSNPTAVSNNTPTSPRENVAASNPIPIANSNNSQGNYQNYYYDVQIIMRLFNGPLALISKDSIDDFFIVTSVEYRNIGTTVLIPFIDRHTITTITKYTACCRLSQQQTISNKHGIQSINTT